MKTRKVLIVLSFMIMLIAIPKNNFAGIQIVPLGNGISSYTAVSASEAFTKCYEMRNNELTGYNVDPHMATSLDWGAVAYLAQSRYGANSSSVSTNTTGGVNLYHFQKIALDNLQIFVLSYGYRKRERSQNK